MRHFTLLFIFSLVFSLCSADDLYTKKSDVFLLNEKNFDKQIRNNRDKDISVVHFYQRNDDQSLEIEDEYERFAKDMRNIFRVGAVNCRKERDLCKKHSVTEFPTIRIYPLNPLPYQDIPLEDGFKYDELKKTMSRLLPSQITKLTSSTIDNFLSQNPTKPKVLLFSQKKGISFLLKALAHVFEGKLIFGFVPESESSIVKNFKVKKYPHLLIVRKVDDKPNHYKGKMEFQDMFAFLNIYSETWVDPSEEKASISDKPTKDWLYEIIPEITKESVDDICYEAGKVICIAYFSDKKPSPNLEKTVKNIQGKYAQSMPKFKFMWLNYKLEQEYFKAFKLDEDILPTLVFLNPGKKKRFLVHTSAMAQSEIEDTIERILDGNARFKILKKGLPNLSDRKTNTDL